MRDWSIHLSVKGCTLIFCAVALFSQLLPVWTWSFVGYGQTRPANLENLFDYYDYDRSLALNASEEIIRDNTGYRVIKVYFDSVRGERVPALLTLPEKGGKFPCVVFLRGYGGRKEDIIAAAEPIAREGYAIMAVDAEYHGERSEEGKELYSPNITDSVRGIVQTVIDLRRAVDYLETKPEIDKDKIGYAGGSMGGIIGAIFIGVEPRIKAAALIVGGGNMSLMLRESEHHTMPAIREFLQKENITYEQVQRLLDPIDPINFISNFSPRPVVFHLGRFDTIVPAEAGRQLCEKAGEPKQVYWYDAGHDVPLELVLARVLDFMDRNLLGKSFVYHELQYWAIRYGPVAAIMCAVIVLLSYLIARRPRKLRCSADR